MYTSTLLTTLFVSSTTVLSAPLTTRSESWPIPQMDVHFMGRDTGLPGNTWPESSKFNSTLDFTVSLPSGDVACSGSWKEKEVPTTPIACAAEGVEFQLSPTSAGILTEAAFTLTVRKTTFDATTGVRTTFVGTQEILANSPGQANSYLSCLGGRPLDGIRCSSKGWASTAGPLALSVSAFAVAKE